MQDLSSYFQRIDIKMFNLMKNYFIGEKPKFRDEARCNC